jgi:GntR family transcriptional regulator of arabinose operon
MDQNESKNFALPAQEIAMQIRDQIRGSGYALGAALPSERQLAVRFNATRWVVRKAMQILEYEHLIARQHGRGTFVVSAADTGPPANLKTGLLGLMLWDVEYAMAPLVHGACNMAAERRFAVTTSSVHNSREEMQAVRALGRNDILGVMLGLRSPAAREHYDELIRNHTAVVLVDTLIPECDEDHVLIDNAKGTYLAVDHLVELGHRRIAYVTHNHMHRMQGRRAEVVCEGDFPIHSDRLRGFIEACRRRDLAIPPEHIIETDEEHYREPFLRMLEAESRPTGVVAYNDAWAIRMIETARSLGLEVPRDLSVVGFDDSVLAPGNGVPLTTINPERYEMGVSAAEMLIAKLDYRKPRAARGVLISPRLVVRQSTAAPPEG